MNQMQQAAEQFIRHSYHGTAITAPAFAGVRIKKRKVLDSTTGTYKMVSGGASGHCNHCQCDCKCESPGG